MLLVDQFVAALHVDVAADKHALRLRVIVGERLEEGAQVGGVQAEVALVLHGAQQEFADGHGPLDEGGEWDHDLQCLPEGERYTLTLTISGTPAFGAAWRAQWGSD